MKYLTLTIILLSIIAPASADITWNQQCIVTAHPSSNITCGNLQTSNIQFSSPVKGVRDINKNIVPEYDVTPGIIFDISYNNFTENSILLTTTNTSYIEQTNKSIRIDVSNFPAPKSSVWLIESYSPSATLTIYIRQLPQVSFSLTSDQSIYEDGKDKNINITLSIENTDTVQFKTARINFNRGNLNLSNTFPSSQIYFNYCCLNQSQTISYTYNLEVPDVTTNTTYSVNATIELQDPEVINKVIDYNVSTLIIVIPQNKEGHVMVTKFIQDRFYTNDNVSVIITISNTGAYSMYGVLINDTLPNTLYSLNSSQKLNWYIPEIKANDGVELSYKVYPVSSGVVILPVAIIKYSYLGQNYQAPSNQVSANIVNNPYVKLRIAPTSVPVIQAQQAIVSKPSMVAPSTPASQSNVSQNALNSPTPTPTSPQYPVKIPGFEGIGTLIIILIVGRKVKK